jgi:hypothetical protein
VFLQAARLQVISDSSVLSSCLASASKVCRCSFISPIKSGILVVEDQPDNRQIIRDMLAGTDYEITEAEDGEQALTAGNTPLPVTHTGHPPTMFRYNVAGQLRILGAILYRLLMRLPPGVRR